MDKHYQTDSEEGDDDEEVDPRLLKDATRTVIWDIAVGCLALSVKVGYLHQQICGNANLNGSQFHRDFLAPLYPVYALDFLSLAPHAMAYDDLEVRLTFFARK
jgi:hypothetical protein